MLPTGQVLFHSTQLDVFALLASSILISVCVCVCVYVAKADHSGTILEQPKYGAVTFMGAVRAVTAEVASHCIALPSQRKVGKK